MTLVTYSEYTGVAGTSPGEPIGVSGGAQESGDLG